MTESEYCVTFNVKSDYTHVEVIATSAAEAKAKAIEETGLDPQTLSMVIRYKAVQNNLK